MRKKIASVAVQSRYFPKKGIGHYCVPGRLDFSCDGHNLKNIDVTICFCDGCLTLSG